MAVADLVQRRDFLGGETACFFQHGIDEITGKVWQSAFVDGLVQARDFFQGKGDFADRRAVHGCSSVSSVVADCIVSFYVNVN